MDRFVHECASELQPCFTGRIGNGANPAVIEETAAVEHDAFDALLDRSLGDRAANRVGALDVAALHVLGERSLQLRIDARRRHQRLAAHVVDHLRVDVADAAEHAQARPLLRSGDPLALPQLNPDPTIVFRLYLHRSLTVRLEPDTTKPASDRPKPDIAEPN